MSELRDPSAYVSRDGDVVETDHAAMLADLTGTEAEEWSDAEGPDSGCGEDYYYHHDVLALDARVNDDQGLLSMTVQDEEGDEVASGSIDMSDEED
jgi:hypothetical protein